MWQIYNSSDAMLRSPAMWAPGRLHSASAYDTSYGEASVLRQG